MNAQTIRRQYDEVIAAHYDHDPQRVIGDSLDTAADQLCRERFFDEDEGPLRVLDLGVGTGSFLAQLKTLGGERVQPFGLDLSEKMVDAARRKVPDLVAEVDDAANLDAHFPNQSFDLICTHFITGFLPMATLAPKIWDRLEEGGYWSFVGGTKAGFPNLQAKANNRLLRRLFGGRTLEIDEFVCNPAGRDEVVQTMAEHGFAARQCLTFEPPLRFRNLKDLIDFGYRGGWLTPFLEALGLHQAGLMTRLVLDVFVFPARDHHSIEIVLARKCGWNNRSPLSPASGDRGRG